MARAISRHKLNLCPGILVYYKTPEQNSYGHCNPVNDIRSPVADVQIGMDEQMIGELNQKGINSLREIPSAGPVIWGARTLIGDDQHASEWKYIPVRRTILFIEESLYRGLQWVIFEPNDEPLWDQIRLNVGTFLNNLWRQGAFQGSTPKEAYFVKCDHNTTTQQDINNGTVNLLVGVAMLKPAEFIIIKLQIKADQRN